MSTLHVRGGNHTQDLLHPQRSIESKIKPSATSAAKHKTFSISHFAFLNRRARKQAKQGTHRLLQVVRLSVLSKIPVCARLG